MGGDSLPGNNNFHCTSWCILDSLRLSAGVSVYVVCIWEFGALNFPRLKKIEGMQLARDT